MNNKKSLLILASSCFLAACGDGLDPGETLTPEPALSCDTPGTVFVDSVCANWQMPSAFEQNKVDYTDREVGHGATGDLIKQRIIQSDDFDRDQVWDIKFENNDELNGFARILPPEGTLGVDMSDYATGKLIFDLKVLSTGETDSGLWTKIECGWPCGTNEFLLPVDELGQWQTHELSVAEFIADGLDIENVAMVFQIFPAWNYQGGAHFQVDNIRWIPGTTPPIEKCFAQHFDDPLSLAHSLTFESQTADIDGWETTLFPTVSINPSWEQATHWRFVAPDTTQDERIDYCMQVGKTLTASVYVAAEDVNDGDYNLGLIIENQGTVTHRFNSVSVSTLTPDAWNTLTVDISAYQGGPADGLGVYFSADNGTPATNNEIRLDNLVIWYAQP